MPGRPVVNGVTPCVVGIEHEAVAHLLLDRQLQTVVVGVICICPLAQNAVVGVWEPAGIDCKACRAKVVIYQTIHGLANVVRETGTQRQSPSHRAVDLLRPEQSVAGGPHIIGFHYQLGHDFTLEAQEVVIDVWILDALGKNDAGQECRVRVRVIPTGKVSDRLRTGALPGIARSAGICRCCTRGCAHPTGACCRSVDDRATHANEWSNFIERVIRRIPAGVGERVVQSAFIRNTKTAAQRGFAIAEYVPGKTHSWPKVVILIGAKTAGWSEAARTAYSSENLRVERDI